MSAGSLHPAKTGDTLLSSGHTEVLVVAAPGWADHQKCPRVPSLLASGQHQLGPLLAVRLRVISVLLRSAATVQEGLLVPWAFVVAAMPRGKNPP